MDRIIKIAELFVLVIFFSCEKQGLFIKCSECTNEEPVNANLEVKVDITDKEPSVLISIYEGNLEDSVLYTSYTSFQEISYTSVNLNKEYTATASYFRSGIKYIAVDSATPRVRYDKNQCDNPCYFVYDDVVNLKLKYTK
jgi:hypothetical protein